MDAGHSPLLYFTNETPDFSHGFECGRVWGILMSMDDAFDCEIHCSNAEMMLRIAEATGRTLRWEEHDERWSTAYFSERA